MLRPAGEDEQDEDPGKHLDPGVHEAISKVPPIAISKEQLSKTGWTATKEHRKVIIGHRPKTFRTPASRHLSFVIRTTWVFRGDEWSKIEDKVDMRELRQKVAKFEEPTILSISVCERPPDNPEPEPDSDHDEAPDDVGGSEKLRLEAETAAHKFTH